MRAEQIHKVSGIAVTVLSMTALLTVLTGFIQPPQPDEGTAAHVFQLSTAALLLAVSCFLTTADWRQPWRSVRPLVIPAAVLVLAFGALYILEHYR